MNFLSQNKKRASQQMFGLAGAILVFFALSRLSPNIFSRTSNAIAVPFWNMRPAISETTGEIPILSRPRWSAYDTFVIGAGASEGISVGDKISSGEFILGEAAEVYERTSLVLLYSTAGKKIEALISGRFPVELVGSGGGTFTADIAVGAPVAEGDKILAQGTNPYVFAVAEAVEDLGGGSAKLYARLPVNIFELRGVEIRK